MRPWLPAAYSPAASGWEIQPGENDGDNALSQIPLSPSSIKAYNARKSKTQGHPSSSSLSAESTSADALDGRSKPSNWSTVRLQTPIGQDRSKIRPLRPEAAVDSDARAPSSLASCSGEARPDGGNSTM
ncbi:hypothetical protein ACLOJK_007430 [Asimina triloba]